MFIVLGLSKTPYDQLTLRVESVQKQEGTSDCGVFAIAFLVDVLLGGNPDTTRLCQALMREHLYKCLSNQKWEAFPTQDSEPIRTKAKNISLKV